MLNKHRDLAPHHKYQLEVVLLFVVALFLFFPYYLIMEEFRINMITGQWYFFWPWTIFYVLYSLYMRRKIKPEERISPLKRPIIHWVVLGIFIIAMHLQPTDLNKLKSIDIMFAIFSLFLADSYWDFKKLNFFKNS